MTLNRVAITGVGIISCLGCDSQTVTNALRAGRSGIVVDEQRLQLGFRSPLTGQISDFNEKKVLSRKERKSMPDFAVQAYAATREALTMSGLSDDELRNPETGLIFGCDSSCIAAIEQVDLLRERQETKSIGSGHIFRSMTSNITMNLNTLLGTQGACWTLSSACSSGGHAIGQAADLIALGRQQRIICGGAQEINWQSMCSFDGLGAFSTHTENPEAACRPFDAKRDGLVPSGGAASVVLEDYALAKARGATILGEVLSYAFSSDGENLSVPSRGGLQRAMTEALSRAELKPEDIDYLCAHATATPAGDGAEADNIKAVFGSDNHESSVPWVSSLKSMTGHELWMSGASQVVYTILMAQDGFIAPNINFTSPDEHSTGLKIVTKTLFHSPEQVLCNSAGFGGTNSCLVLRMGE
ncbi:MAG: beta-ketoacyl-[acyl-carrier-protein] synthase family protein [Thermodesulfobacteriota bacterium]|nr:beta-ketoacyl-[acyl-carrier-protein] synthase family protein [Thermodesulfobacteriota bacterium]